MAGAAANMDTTRKKGQVGRVRKTAMGWMFEVQSEYPLQDEMWIPFAAADDKDTILGIAIKAQLNGWIKEWHEDHG